MTQRGKHLRGTCLPHCLENPLRETGSSTLHTSTTAKDEMALRADFIKRKIFFVDK